MTERRIKEVQTRNSNNGEKEIFMNTMDQLLTERLSKKDRSSNVSKKDSTISFPKAQTSYSPFNNNRSSLSPRNENKSIIAKQQQSQSVLRNQYLRASNQMDVLRQSLNNLQSQRNNQSLISNKESLSINKSLTNLSVQQQAPNQNQEKQMEIIESTSPDQNKSQPQNDEQVGAKIDIDTFIEDTFIFNIQKLTKVKKKMIDCTREYRKFTITHSPRKHHSRIIEALGLNPLDKMSRRKVKMSKDPNLVFIELDCSEKYGGARDIIEIKVNKSPPLLLNSRQQTHYELQYSNYTGLLNSIGERSNGLVNSQMMLNKLTQQMSTNGALRSLQKDNIHKLLKKQSQQSSQMKQEQSSTSISVAQDSNFNFQTPNFIERKFSFAENGSSQNTPNQSQTLPNVTISQSNDKKSNQQDTQIFDVGFIDSSKSYLQTLEEFSNKIAQYDNFQPKDAFQGNFYEIQSQILNKAYKIDQGYSLVDSTNLQKLFLQNYKECLLRLVKVMPITGCMMHQLVSYLMYQVDRSTRVIINKEKYYLETIDKYFNFVNSIQIRRLIESHENSAECKQGNL
ncbi:UNKNOWN [Stylonychia lemnae]|uniref:Uncharacterized protein n=1 Tax=Stylonychia lemnae TaxID=5949 RepID=A0A078AWQ4_STYLE|nr:UNKNOWN [Stylonychia lemnae]|eukprot:CDW86594.1 UNKNOWN [Stylonychia lemnae]